MISIVDLVGTHFEIFKNKHFQNIRAVLALFNLDLPKQLLNA